MCDNRIDLKPNKLIHKFGGAFDLPIFPPIFDPNGRTLNPAQVMQTLNKCVGPCLGGGVAIRTQKAEDRDSRRLLRANRERPGDDDRSHYGYETAASNHHRFDPVSSTSSANGIMLATRSG